MVPEEALERYCATLRDGVRLIQDLFFVIAASDRALGMSCRDRSAKVLARCLLKTGRDVEPGSLFRHPVCR